MAAGGLARIELAGGASHAALELPRPTGTIALRVTGAVSDLRIRAGNGRPVRLRLGKGADTATVDGTSHRNVKSGTAITLPGLAVGQEPLRRLDRPRGWARSSSTTRHEADADVAPLLLLGEHDLAALADRRQDGDDERRHRQRPGAPRRSGGSGTPTGRRGR